MRQKAGMAIVSLGICAVMMAGCGQTTVESTSTVSSEAAATSAVPAEETVAASESEREDFLQLAEEAFEDGDYTNAVKNSLMAYYKKPEDSIDFSVIGKAITAIAENNQMENPEVLIMEYSQSKQFSEYIRVDLQCDAWNGKKLSQCSEDEILEMYRDFNSSFEEVVVGASNAYIESQREKKLKYFGLGDIKNDGTWYVVYLEDGDVEQENDDEHAKMEQLAFGNSSGPAWTTGGPGAESAKADSQEYRNALTKGLQYANQLHMSKKAIYDQLTSSYGEGFPADAAQYAVDHMTDVDWNANALAKAEEYYYKMSMSKSAVYDQLTSSYGEQFTASQAQYAIDNLD